jgi:hypothetical protein
VVRQTQALEPPRSWRTGYSNLIAECLRDQLQTFAVGGFNGFELQCIAQGVRHCLRIAKIAHENTSSSANGKIGACLADPFANGEGAERR